MKTVMENSQLYSQGSIYHHDIWVAQHHVGTLCQNKQSICSLKWLLTNQLLASGSSDGILNIWPSDPGVNCSQPLKTISHSSAVKAMNWCPWQSKVLVTGGGMKDGILHVWDINSEKIIQSAATDYQRNSRIFSEYAIVLHSALQCVIGLSSLLFLIHHFCLHTEVIEEEICSLLWLPKTSKLMTGQGLPGNPIKIWKYPMLINSSELYGKPSQVQVVDFHFSLRLTRLMVF
ncbi:LOW QUALITY PROTEIN: cell division cycle protein 20 homolog B-like [Sarcoramphus papa]